jgi:hypothetical protein
MLSSAVLAQDESTSADTPPEVLATKTVSATSDNVRRAVFTTSVVKREPVDELDSIPRDAVNICFFSEIVNLTDGSITHRWIHGGEAMAEVTFNSGGPRWRVFSRKTLPPDGTGSWTVEIVDGDGNILQRAALGYDDGQQDPVTSE